MASTLKEAPGTIEHGVFYTLAEFQNRVRWNRHAMRQARKAGLRVRYMHGRAYVHGDDLFAYLNKLDEQEKRLVEILIDEHRDKPKWYNGRYISKSTKPAPKTRFKQEVSDSEHDYRVSYANVRYWFYSIFGTLKEAKREKEWYDHFSPRKGSLHASRDGKYQQTGKYARKNEGEK